MFITRCPIVAEMLLEKKTDTSCGATALFAGIVRDRNDGRPVSGIYYECYEEMAEKQIRTIVEQARKEDGIRDVRVLHRVGWLEIGETAVVIAVSGVHRREALRVCEKVLEDVKSKVPIWKREVYADGASGWVMPCCREKSEIS